jgi:uroporphyrinogen-III synthase
MADPKVPSQQVIESTQQPLAGRTILISPDYTETGLKVALEDYGARVIAWPRFEIHELQNLGALDEAIDNLFGYDWMIFRSVPAAESFLGRLADLGHEISELDSLRVLAFGAATSDLLEFSQVHVDLVAPEDVRKDALAEIEHYLGGTQTIEGTNFLNLRAANSCETLSSKLENRGARVDRVAAYRTVSNDEQLIRLKTLLAGGGIDCLVIQSASDCKTLAELFDESDLRTPLDGAVVACGNWEISQEVEKFGLKSELVGAVSAVTGFVRIIAEHLSGPAANRQV